MALGTSLVLRRLPLVVFRLADISLFSNGLALMHAGHALTATSTRNHFEGAHRLLSFLARIGGRVVRPIGGCCLLPSDMFFIARRPSTSIRKNRSADATLTVGCDREYRRQCYGVSPGRAARRDHPHLCISPPVRPSLRLSDFLRRPSAAALSNFRFHPMIRCAPPPSMPEIRRPDIRDGRCFGCWRVARAPEDNALLIEWKILVFGGVVSVHFTFTFIEFIDDSFYFESTVRSF